MVQYLKGIFVCDFLRQPTNLYRKEDAFSTSEWLAFMIPGIIVPVVGSFARKEGNLDNFDRLKRPPKLLSSEDLKCSGAIGYQEATI